MLAVANYHYIREDFSAEYQSIFGLTPKQFRAQLEALSREGHFISQDRLLDLRNRKFDRNYILVTFDDGLKEQYELARPILNDMGIPFIFFINTSNFQERSVSLVHKIHLLRSRISSKDLLKELETSPAPALTPEEKKWGEAHYNYDEPETAHLKYLLNFKLKLPEQQEFIDPLFRKVFEEPQIAASLYFDKDMLRQLAAEDSLGSHSHHHLPLGGLAPENLSEELTRSQDFFRKEFGKPALSISYPYGSLQACSGIREQVREKGFQLGFTMERALNMDLQEDSLLLSRFDCNDLPLGKNDLFRKAGLFEKPVKRKWQHEDSSTNQR